MLLESHCIVIDERVWILLNLLLGQWLPLDLGSRVLIVHRGSGVVLKVVCLACGTCSVLVLGRVKWPILEALIWRSPHCFSNSLLFVVI